MLILNPQRVELGSLVIDRVTAVTIDRATVTPIEQWGATGPWCALADSTKRRVSITVSPNPTNLNRRTVRCTCVVVAVRYEQPVGKPPVRTVSLLAVSAAAPAGSTDPVVIEEAAP